MVIIIINGVFLSISILYQISANLRVNKAKTLPNFIKFAIISLPAYASAFVKTSADKKALAGKHSAVAQLVRATGCEHFKNLWRKREVIKIGLFKLP